MKTYKRLLKAQIIILLKYMRRKLMAKAVYRKNKDGKVTYVGHVPPEYQLKENEFFGKLPNEKRENYVDYLLEKYGRRN